MANTDILFWAALALCAFAMLCFAILSYIQIRKREDDPSGTRGGAGLEAIDSPLSGVLDALSKVSAAFGTAGPISTAATLAIFFMIVALIASGLITIGASPGTGG